MENSPFLGGPLGAFCKNWRLIIFIISWGSNSSNEKLSSAKTSGCWFSSTNFLKAPEEDDVPKIFILIFAIFTGLVGKSLGNHVFFPWNIGVTVNFPLNRSSEIFGPQANSFSKLREGDRVGVQIGGIQHVILCVCCAIPALLKENMTLDSTVHSNLVVNVMNPLHAELRAPKFYLTIMKNRMLDNSRPK